MGLRIVKNSSRLKAMNSVAKLIQGSIICSIKVGFWEDQCNFMVVPLDDFDLILVLNSSRWLK